MSMFGMEFDGIDDYENGGQDIVEQTKQEVWKQLRDIMQEKAHRLKSLIKKQIKSTSAGKSVDVKFGHGKKTIPPLADSTKSQKDGGKMLIDEGVLISSIQVDKVSDSYFRVGALSSQSNNGMPVKEYAVIQELGSPSQNIPPRPFLIPAFNKFLGEFKRAVNSRIEGVDFTIHRQRS
jgi:hypothetical protein